MLDDNLPTFFLKPSSIGQKHQQNFFLSHHGSEPAPSYILQHASPSQAHKNCYAAALSDAYNPDIVFGEVLARPGWTQPTLSQEEVRRNGGVPPPPQPVLPNEFVIQLYDPDQQVRVELKEGKWGGSDSYEFSMPISTFRTPSASSLDRGQSDPASLAITPKVHFAWRKESKLGKDLTCFMTGRSTDAKEKKKSRRDPDIAIALWRSMRELTIYEPNLSRVDIEDPKGLELVLLLSAVVIKDLYFGNKDNMRETFNIANLASDRKLSGGGRKLSNPQQQQQQAYSMTGAPNPLYSHPPVPTSNEQKRTSLPRLQTTPPNTNQQRRPPPPPMMADPRAQWELDQETARLKAQSEAEARAEHRRRHEREKADEAEAKRLQRQIEDEDRQARRKQTEVDRETERLRKLYGVPPIGHLPGPPPRPHSSSGRQHSSRQQQPYMQPIPQRARVDAVQQPPRIGSNGLYVQQQPSAAASSSALVMSGGNGNASRLDVSKPIKAKKSFFGLRSVSDDTAAEGSKLRKKGSTMCRTFARAV
ncbi:hypothetical protein LTR56_007795 [Elasticomyces elasticus]|nr:hypothetical protein LTR56_007795 [Elasticomyces elasticus]KAK3667844.1 hypothetical protein LTR22_001289 [Elasticomyces elasticus]KAK5763457.1 hypothetical protein LTS12_006428 [Elasticomyces elasticus]